MILVLAMIVFVFISLSNGAVAMFLKGKTEQKDIELVGAIILMPGIPLFWLITQSMEVSYDAIWTFYASMGITILYISMLLTKIRKVAK